MQHVDDISPMPDDEFWAQRPILTHIRDFAWSRLVAPYAMLGCVMRRAVSCVEPNVVLPATVGGVGSLNLFTANIGYSGQGKDAPEAAGWEAVRFLDMDANDQDAPTPNIGSGEGLARLFKGGKDTAPLTRAHLVVNEVRTLGALIGRQGSTLSGELTKAFSGQALGFHNAQKDTTTAIDKHSYRLCLGIGVQPGNANIILGEADTGLPQRFLWLPSIDPSAPEHDVPEVQPRDIIVPGFQSSHDNRYEIVAIPDEVRAEIRDRRRNQLRGIDTSGPLDKHIGLLRLKVAFALALLDGRKDISTDDWKLGGELLDLSLKVRTEAVSALDAIRRRDNAAKAHNLADRETIVRERLAEDSQTRVNKRIVAKLKKVHVATEMELRRACESAIRADFHTVFEGLLDSGLIFCCEEGDRRNAARYKLSRP